MTNNYRIEAGWLIFDKANASLCLALQDMDNRFPETKADVSVAIVGHINGEPFWKLNLESYLTNGIINNLEYVDLFNYIDKYIKSHGTPVVKKGCDVE